MSYLLVALLTLSSVLAEDQEHENFQLANIKFASDVYTQIAYRTPDNVIVSPFSAGNVLALLALGTKGDTYKQLKTTLGLSDNRTVIELGTKRTLEELAQGGDDYAWNLANKLFIQKNFSVNEDFKKTAVKYFYSDVQNLDFSKPSDARNTINQWVEDQTNHTIKDLIAPGVLNAQTRLVLVNALHLKASWVTKFSSTTKESFFVSPSQAIQVDTLHHKRKSFNYYSCVELGVEVLELPLEGQNAFVTIFLPLAKDGIKKVEAQALKLFSTNFSYKRTLLDVSIPKFKFTNSIPLEDILKNLGVTSIFDPSSADLSGISGKKGDLVVSAVQQKAFIDFNANGIEASAATYVGVVATSVISGEPRRFVADHPFLFLIKKDGVLLFVGKVVNPQ